MCAAAEHICPQTTTVFSFMHLILDIFESLWKCDRKSKWNFAIDLKITEIILKKKKRARFHYAKLAKTKESGGRMSEPFLNANIHIKGRKRLEVDEKSILKDKCLILESF